MPLLEQIANRLLAVRHKQNTLRYIESFGRNPNYWSPRGYSEKIHWRKLFDRNPLINLFCDKLASRDYVAKRAPALKLPRLLWSGEDPQAIPFDRLEPPFVIKPNNRSRAIIKVRCAADLDSEAVRRKAAQWLTAAPYGWRLREWGYRPVKTKIMIEEFLSEGDNLYSPPGYMFHVFNGRAAFATFISKDNPGRNTRRAVYTPAWERLPWSVVSSRGPLNYLDSVPAPPCLTDMTAAAEAIAREVDYLRVDLYCVKSDMFFGELTPYHMSGLSAYVPNTEMRRFPPPRELDDAIGDLWTLPSIPPLTRLRRGLFGRTRNGQSGALILPFPIR